jgi:tetratricopeptide (TPR) repeat protein
MLARVPDAKSRLTFEDCPWRSPTGDCLDDTTLAAHVDATCDEATRARVEAHLDHCQDCRELVAEFAQTFLTKSTDVRSFDGDLRMLEPGAKLGRYVIVSSVGSGAMGIVYAAQDTELGRKVALKLLRSERASALAIATEARILDEARTMAKLTHPSVIAIHDVEVVDGLPFAVMELVEGPTLRLWCKHEPRGTREILRVFLEAARGLAAAHRLGIVHRDFKPDNVLIGADGRARITDFGLATVTEPDRVSAEVDGSDLETPLWTRTGVLVGTPAYMAPEQLDGALGDARSDQFAFAVALFEALTGERPFSANSVKELLARIREGKRSAKETQIPGWIRRALDRALAVRPEDRFSSMETLVGLLERDPRRRLQWLAAGAAGVAVVGLSAGIVTMRSTTANICRTEPHTRAWSEERARSIEDRFRAVAPELTKEAWPLVRTRLDGHTRELDAARMETCEATRVHGTQSMRTMELRMQCLDRRRDEVAALVRVLGEADEATVRRATSAAAELTPASVCSETSAVSTPIPVPDNPAIRREVDAIRTDLARSAALERAGKYREALEWTRPLTERASQTSFLPVRAEARLRQGMLEDENGDSKTARQTLLAAVYDAEAGRHDDIAAEAWVALVYVTGNQLEMHPETESAEERARAAIARLGSSPRLETRLLVNVGAWLNMRGKFADSVAKLRAAVALAERHAGARHPEVAEALTWLSQSLRETGEVTEAIEVATRALTIRQEALGSGHPSVAETLGALGVGLSRLGRHAEAVPHYQRALDIRRQTLGPKHPEVASMLGNLGLAYARSGRFDEAVRALEQTLTLDREAWGPDDSEVATAQSNLGYAYLLRGSWADARTQIEQAIVIREKRQGKDHPFVGRSLSNLGWALLGEGKTTEARLAFERARGILERANGPDHPDVAAQLVGLGTTLLATREATRSIPLFERALVVYSVKPAAADRLADAKFGLARALIETRGDHVRAVTLAREARDGYASVGFTEQKRLDVERWLARVR